MSVESSVDVREVERALDRIARFGKDMTKIHKAMRPVLTRDQKEHRTKQAGPSGAWPALSPFTVERNKARMRKRKKGQKGRPRGTRKMLGKLPTAYKIFISSQSLRLVSRVAWSGAHQEGASGSGRRRVTIPARPFFWISEKAVRRFVEVIEKRAGKTWWGMHL